MTTPEMRIALLSDIHGNLLGLEAVLADMQQHGPYDEVVIAGDLCWAGPWPAEVVDRVRALDATVIQGNTDSVCDPSSTSAAREEAVDPHFAALRRWTLGQLGEERASYLAGLPFAHRVTPAAHHDLLIVHANPHDFSRPIRPEMDDEELEALVGPASSCDWQALAFGHLHVPYTRRWRDRLLVDVASVGAPMDGDLRATYAVLSWDGTDWLAEHHRVFYETPVVVHEMRSCGMPRGDHFAKRLLSASYPGMPR